MTVSVAPPPARFDVGADVVVIGAGACGLTAGLRALEGGAEVVVAERDARPSGSTSMSSGFVPAPGTRFQRAIGVHETPADFAADIQRKAKGGADPAVVRAVTERIGPALEWLADAHGLEWHVLDDFLYPGHSAYRMHAVPERTGAGLMARLLAAAETAGLTVVSGARATVLHVADGDRVGGVTLARPNGRAESIGCRAVVLACNGYGGNPNLVAEHIPEIAAAPYFGHPGNTGDALAWGRALGAATRDLGAYQGHGSLAHPQGVLITWALMMEGGIQVNAAGRRFSNEHEGYSEQAVRVLSQPGGVAWNVYDDRLHEMGMEFPDYRTAVDAGAMKVASDAAALAGRIGVPPAALGETLARMAECCAERAADPFGRDFTLKPMLTGRLRAIRVTGALFHTQGGLAVDAGARVLRPDSTPIPGLFAAGGAACGVSGSRVEGYLSGNGLLTAIGLGFIAGERAAAR
jgi:fumarate reductase flavoprotein subunit